MRRLVYTSTAVNMLDERGLQQILISARNQNGAYDITGLLIYHDGCFLQVLEGSETALKLCYARILQDPRHENCIKMADDAVVGRMFPEWWMSYRAFDDLGPNQRAQFISLQAFANRARGNDLTNDHKTNAFLLAFLSSFRDLDIAG